MSENKKLPPPQKSFSPDWLVRGVLSKLGESFDKLTGRNWKPSSTLATSELIERLKKLLDAKVRDLGENGRFVPHSIKLKMQWDKFSTDAEKALEKLRTELHAAAIDHINDNRYHTYAPLKVEVKPDYFTEGVNLHASFEKYGDQPGEEEEDVLKVTMPNVNLQNIVINPEPEPEPEPEKFVALFKSGGREKSVELSFKTNQRRNVGRTKENDLSIEDPSVSKIHASLVLNAENQLLVADTGSTNGTFINDRRIAYGRALAINEGDRVKFGTIEVFFRRVPKAAEFETRESYETPTLAPAETRQLVLNPQAAEAPQPVARETAAAIKQNPAPPAETEPPADVYKTGEPSDIFKTGGSFEINNGASQFENNQPNNQTAAETKENSLSDGGGNSRVFQTEQRINFDFGDDGDGSSKK